MNKFEKIIFLAGISASVFAGVTSLIISSWTLGVTQLSLGWFMFLHYKNKNK
jgi:hypothetical protein